MRAWRKLALRAAGLGGLVLVAVTVVVELESEYRLEHVSSLGGPKALVLYHPSRDARFSDDLSLAAGRGFAEARFTVDRATLTRYTPGRPKAYELIAVVSNTYFATPDLPTLRYLRRADLSGIAVIGLIGGAGSTARSERLLREALLRTGADVMDTRSYWLLRPNDERRMDESNRSVAIDLAAAHARHVAVRLRHTP